MDPIRLEIFRSLFQSAAEEMGAALRRSAFSPNIKERRDYSCAVFTGEGEVVAMGDHMPVHLGAMPRTLQAVRRALSLGPGDVAMVNDPFEGGSHLPDLTLAMPILFDRRKGPLLWVANRAHHADVGGALAGSMSPAREIYQEGLRIPPMRIFRAGKMQREVLEVLLRNTRTPREREGDLTAQIAACRVGERRLVEIAEKYGSSEVRSRMRELLDYSERLMRAALRRIPQGEYTGVDFLDGDGIQSGLLRIAARVTITRESVQIDFTGTAPQCAGNLNATVAITESAVFYVFRSLLPGEAPSNGGLLRPIRVLAPEGTLVNATPPAAVAGGNVETSQRIVDVLLRALARALPGRIPAASQGTMNNLTFGGADPRFGGAPFAYYETIGGGMGATPLGDGSSGIHSHMTNSWNTPVEALEHACPVRVLCYSLRRGSGGAGKFRGGDGIRREIKFLVDAECALLSDRREIPPYGLAGGGSGATGRQGIRGEKRKTSLEAKCRFSAPRGSVLTVETPGGGGWGRPARKKLARNPNKAGEHGPASRGLKSATEEQTQTLR